MSKNKLLSGLCVAAVIGLFAAGVRAAEIAPGTMDFLAATEISGYVDVTYAYDVEGSPAQGLSANGIGGAGGIGPRANDFSLNQFKLTLNKPLGKDDWDAGYRVDIVAGQDAGFINPGLTTASNITLEQAYVTARLPLMAAGLDIKAGVFVSPFGNEVFETPSNFNITRSLLFLFGQPRTLTGISAAAAWDLGGVKLDTLVGIANGWNTVADANDSKSYFAQVRAEFWDGKASIATGGIIGTEGTGAIISGAPDDDNDYRWLWDTVITVKPIDGLTASLNVDWAQESFNDVAFSHNEWWGIAGTVHYKWSDLIDTAIRGEFFSDRAENTPSAAGVIAAGFPAGANTRTGFDQDIWAVTGTINFNIWKNLLTRVEVRYAHTNAEILPSDDADGVSTFGQNGQFAIAVEAAYSF